MREEIKNRLLRQATIGVDKGLRLKLRWESGFELLVHSWDAAAAITKRSIRKNTLTRGSAFRQNFYAGMYDEGIELLNPETLSLELCFITLVQHAKRGAPVDPAVQERKKKELQLKIAKFKNRVVEMEEELKTYD